MPTQNPKWLSHNDILSLEEIADVVRVGVSLGIDKVRLTGGEPLVRKNVLELVRLIGNIPGVNDFAITTNGILLGELAIDLKLSGLKRINISLDCLDPEKYFEITGGDLNKVLVGIKKAIQVGFNPIKINCVVNQNANEPDALAIQKFADEFGLIARFIPIMALQQGQFGVVESGGGGDCINCNRLRMLSNGDIKPCLFSDNVFNIRTLGIKEALIQAILEKPEKGLCCRDFSMHQIGG
jgi:cyclic pyranopterin phosphate synthase